MTNQQGDRIRHEPRYETILCPTCNGATYNMWGDALAIYADPCHCAHNKTPGHVTRLGIPTALDLRTAYASPGAKR